MEINNTLICDYLSERKLNNIESTILDIDNQIKNKSNMIDTLIKTITTDLNCIARHISRIGINQHTREYLIETNYDDYKSLATKYIKLFIELDELVLARKRLK